MVLTKFDINKTGCRCHTGTPSRPCHCLNPWNSQAGIEGSPQDVLQGSTGISSDRNSVHPSARRPSKTIQCKQQQLQKTNSLIRLHAVLLKKNVITLFGNTNSIFSSNVSSNRAPALCWTGLFFYSKWAHRKTNNQTFFSSLITYIDWPCYVNDIRRISMDVCLIIYVSFFLFFFIKTKYQETFSRYPHHRQTNQCRLTRI